ncbi:transglutaminase-like domain-containing protein [Archaeoglobus sp.]
MNEKWIIIAVASILVLCTQIGSKDISREEYCEKLWRYDIECAIGYMFTAEELQKISEIAEKLRGSNCKQTAWNVLEWVDRNVEYDFKKASLPPPQVEISPVGIKVYNKERYFQTPSETVMMGKGICGDYAILTAALLLYNGCKAYIVNITFDGYSEGHITAAIKINNSYYFLDQHLPPLDAGSYYKKWLKDGRVIIEAVIYSVNGTSELLDKTDFSSDYQITLQDVLELKEEMTRIIESEYELKEDLRLGEKLPKGYTSGKILTLTMEDMADYYTPEFKKEFAGYIVDKLVSKEDTGNYRSFKLDVEVLGNDIVAKMYLAK